MHESGLSGLDKHDQPSVTADFLLALSELDLPDHLKSKSAHLGVIDVIVTAGNGRKWGPDTAYIGIPTRMKNKKFASNTASDDTISVPVAAGTPSRIDRSSPDQSVIDPQLLALSSGSPQARRSSKNSVLDPQLQSEHPALPRAHRTMSTSAIDPELHVRHSAGPQARPASTASVIDPQLLADSYPMHQGHQTSDTAMIDPQLLAESPALPQTQPKTPKRKAKSYELVPTSPTTTYGPEVYKAVEKTAAQTYIASYSNAHGTARGMRTMRQRLGDMRKMSPEKQKSVLREMRSQLSEQDIEAIMKNLKIDPAALDESPSKKVRFTSPIVGPDPEAGFDPFALGSATYESSMIPSRYDGNLYGSAPKPAVVQQRIEMARELGASESGGLMQKLSPVKRRKQTALSAAPGGLTEQLPSPSPRRKASTPKKGSETREALVAAEAEEKFEVPRLSKGSAVGYAAAGTQRQITKIRGGEFEEEEFLVGMRFYVW